MFVFAKPDEAAVRRFIESSRTAALSYPFAGMTRDADSRASGGPEIDAYNIDHNRVALGRGKTVWDTAKMAIRRWKMFDFPWVELFRHDTPITEGETVAILVSHLGFYSLNAARIVYTFDEPNRFGFAYGTLTDHGESGEERFSVEKDEDTGEVHYDLYAFSKPNQLMAYLGYPYTRTLQKRFASDSKAAMLRAVGL